jgi:hypothetical protein
MLFAVAAAAGSLAQACGDGPTPLPTPPPDRTLRVTVVTTGVDFDGDGYLLHGDNIEQAIVSAGTVTIYRDLAPGSYEFRLDGLAANCTLDGPDAVPVTIVDGHLSSVSFRVQCTATTGVFRVSAPTTGRDYATASYLVVLAGGGLPARSVSMRPNRSTNMESIPGGTYELTLQTRADNCQVSGDNPLMATIVVGDPYYRTTEVVFQVQCSPTTGDVHLLTATTGADVDPDGYAVWRDGRELIVTYEDPFYYPPYTRSFPLRLAADDEWTVTEVVPGTYAYELRGLAANCRVDGANPRAVSVAAGITSEVRFSVICSSLP